jgi:DNA helicase MCM9
MEVEEEAFPSNLGDLAETTLADPHFGEIEANNPDLLEMLEDAFYREQLEAILLAPFDETGRRHYSVTIRFGDLADAVPHLASQLERNARYVLNGVLPKAFLNSLSNKITSESEKFGHATLTDKQNINARCCDIFSMALPSGSFESSHESSNRTQNAVARTFAGVESMIRENVSSIRAQDKGLFIQVTGTIIRMGLQRLVERRRWFKCAAKECGHEFQLRVAIEHDHTVILPSKCPNPNPVGKSRRGGGRGGSTAGSGPKFCSGKVFVSLEEREKVMSDYQEVKLQEPVSSLALGCIPRSMIVILEHDLVDSVKAGDDVIVTGLVVHRWLKMSKGQRAVLEPVLHANHIRPQQIFTDTGLGKAGDPLVTDFHDFWAYFGGLINKPLKGRDVIVRSVCPQLHGMARVKLALLMILIGANENQNAPKSTRVKTRGDCHLLLVGDPGTGKSQLMRYACLLVPRSVHTTGVGTTQAGLTCSAARDGEDWVLEAGALVLADRGLCVIDEFGAMRNEDRTAIHEAMEQQTISVAKAGLVTTLNTRCSIIAASNPKAHRGASGPADFGSDLSTLTGISSPLLSRFDLIITLGDRKDPVWDERVASFILSQACHQSMMTLSVLHKRSLKHAQRAAKTAANEAASQGASAVVASSAAEAAALTSELNDSVFLGSTATIEDKRPQSVYRSQMSAFIKLHQSSVAPSFEEIGVDGGARLANGARIEDQLRAELISQRDDQVIAQFNQFHEQSIYAPSAPRSSPEPKYAISGKDIRWSLSRLRPYIAYIKDRLACSLSAGAQGLIKSYFLLQRVQDARSQARTTTRLLESVVRLSKAHARLLFRRQVLIQDAVVAISLIESSASSSSLGLVKNVPIAQSEFSPDPDAAYIKEEEMVLHRLVSCNVSLKQSGIGTSATDNSLPQTVAQWQALSQQQLKADSEWRSSLYSESKLAWGIQFEADEERGLNFSEDAHIHSGGESEDNGVEVVESSLWRGAQPIQKKSRFDEGGNSLNVTAFPSYDSQAWGINNKPTLMAPPTNRIPIIRPPIGVGGHVTHPVMHKYAVEGEEEEEEEDDVPDFARNLLGGDDDDRW